jgi:hypothetical protein|tara:strand:+ start:385 stop:615 length:231 start_codon:yes stop_codon:yes gene_type:complete
MSKKNGIISAEDFITAWQTSESMPEFVEKTSMTPRGASVRASQYRKKGVPLKKFVAVGSRRLDWSKLSSLAEELAK